MRTGGTVCFHNSVYFSTLTCLVRLIVFLSQKKALSTFDRSNFLQFNKPSHIYPNGNTGFLFLFTQTDSTTNVYYLLCVLG